MVDFGLVAVLVGLVVWVVLFVTALAKWGNRSANSGSVIVVIAFAALIAFMAYASWLGWIPAAGTYNNVPWPPR